jgi:hypothetical protein
VICGAAIVELSVWIRSGKIFIYLSRISSMLYFHSHVVGDGAVIYIFRCETESGGVAPSVHLAGTSCMWKFHMLLLPSNIIRLQCSKRVLPGAFQADI